MFVVDALLEIWPSRNVTKERGMTRSSQIIIGVLLVLTPALAAAHVSITPRESTHGGTEKYTVRIPTEGKVATTAAEIEVPEGVIVETLQAPMGWTYDIK